MLLSEVPFGDVKHTDDTILRARKKQFTGYGVGQYECSFTTSATRLCWLTLCPRVCTWRWLTMIRTSRKPSNSSMLKAQTGNTSSLRWVGSWYETGCRGGGCHMDWLNASSLFHLWVNVLSLETFSHNTITYYQMIVSKDLIITSFDTGFQLSVWLSKDLIIKSKSSTIKSINTPQKSWLWVLVSTRGPGPPICHVVYWIQTWKCKTSLYHLTFRRKLTIYS
jgi:hypothetical protein